MQVLKIKTNYKSEIIDITKELQEAVIKSGIKSGVLNIFCPHTTANVILFENSDASLKRDLLGMLKDVVPFKNYAHNNARAHLKAALLRNNLSLIVENAKIILGKWQGIYFVELDGPRDRNIYIKVMNG